MNNYFLLTAFCIISLFAGQTFASEGGWFGGQVQDYGVFKENTAVSVPDWKKTTDAARKQYTEYNNSEKPLVLARINPPAELQRLKKIIYEQLPTLRQALGKPIFDGKFITLKDPSSIQVWQDGVTNEGEQAKANVQFFETMLEQNGGHLFFDLERALIMSDVPNFASLEGQRFIRTVIAHCCNATIYGHVIPLREHVKEKDAQIARESEQRQKAQAEILVLNQQKQTADRQVATLQININSLQERNQKAAADIDRSNQQHATALAALTAKENILRKEMEEKNKKTESDILEIRTNLLPPLVSELNERRARSPLRRQQIQNLENALQNLLFEKNELREETTLERSRLREMGQKAEQEIEYLRQQRQIALEQLESAHLQNESATHELATVRQELDRRIALSPERRRQLQEKDDEIAQLKKALEARSYASAVKRGSKK